MIRISIAEAGKPPRLLTFSKLEVTLGRDAHNDLCLTGKGVSGRHCRLVRHGDATLIEDLGSTNGTYVNRTRIAAATPISSSDEVVLAVYRLQILNDADSGLKMRPSEAAGPGGGVVVGAHPHRAGPTAAHPSVPGTAAPGGGVRPHYPGGLDVSGSHTSPTGMSQSVPTHGPSGPHVSPSTTAAVDQSGAQAQPHPHSGSHSRPVKARVNSADDLEWGREWEQIDRLAKEWFSRGRPRRGLLVGAPLARGKQWLARGRGKHPQPTSAHRQFIDAAVRRRRLQIFSRMTLVAVVLGGAGVAGTMAYRMGNEDTGDSASGSTDGTDATQDKTDLGGGTQSPTTPGGDPVELANRAAGLIPTNPVLAALVAAEAASLLSGADAVRPDHPAAEALRRALAQIGSRPLLGHGGPVADVAVSPDGHFVASSTKRRGEPVRLWDLEAPGRLEPALLSNHAGRVTAMAMTDDGHWLLTADDDGLVMRWDLTASDPPSSGVRMDGHSTAVAAMRLAGPWLVTGDETGRVQLWNVNAPLPSAVALRGNESQIRALDVAADGSRVASVAEDGTGRIWSVDAGAVRGKPVTLLRPEEFGVGPLLSVAISPDGAWVLTGASDGVGWLWKTGVRNPLRNAPPPLMGKHREAITQVGFSRDGAIAYTAGNDDKIILWDMTAANPNDKVWPWAGHSGDIIAIDTTGSGPGERDPAAGVAYLVSASGDGTARRWNLDERDGAIEVEVLKGHTGQVNAVDASADGRWIVTAGEDKSAQVFAAWRAETADRRRVPGLGASRVGFGHAGPVRQLAMNGGGNRLVTASDDGTARVWDLVSPGRLKTVGLLGDHPGRVRAVAITNKARFAATGADGGELRLWNLEAADPGQGHLKLKGHTKDIRGLAFTNKYLVSASTDGTARLWDMTTPDPNEGEVVLQHGDEVVGLAVSGNGRWLLTATGTEIKGVLWDLSAENPAAGNVTLKGHSDALTTVALGPSGRWAATGSRDYRVHLWDLSREKPKKTKLRKHDGEISALSFSPDGGWLGTADGGGAVIVWDLQSKHPDEDFERLPGPTSGIYSLSWTADGRWLVAGSGDRAVYMWRVERGGEQAAPVVLEGHEGVVSGVAVARDASFVVSAGFDGTARLWPMNAKAVVSIVCGRAGRWLSPSEWDEYVGGDFVDRCPRR